MNTHKQEKDYPTGNWDIRKVWRRQTHGMAAPNGLIEGAKLFVRQTLYGLKPQKGSFHRDFLAIDDIQSLRWTVHPTTLQIVEHFIIYHLSFII